MCSSDLKKRFARIDDLGVSPAEFRLLQRLNTQHPDVQFRLVIGSDILREGQRWHRFDEVLRLARVAAGDTVLDLYSGAGLFAGCIAAAEPGVAEVVAVESSIDAVRDARRSLSDLGTVTLVTADVPSWLGEHAADVFDVVVADPPRAGVGQESARIMAAMARRAIVYVACEPSSLARDTQILRECGWELRILTAFDAFPMTSHVECVALFTRPESHAEPAGSLERQP